MHLIQQRFRTACQYSGGQSSARRKEDVYKRQIENRVPTLIAVPTVNLIKNRLPEHADLLGVYGGVTNQEIADYLKTHDR